MALSAQAATPQALVEAYLRCLLVPDSRHARALIDDGLQAGVPATTLYLKVIGPAMHEVGRLWEAAGISVAQEHLCTQITQTVMATLALQLSGGEPIGAGRTAVVSSTPRERHALASQMVSDFLEAQGWSVLALGADTPIEELVGLVADRRPDLVAMSTSLPGHLLSATRTCQLLRRLDPAPLIVVGGRAYRGDAARAAVVGADALAADPQQLLALLACHFPEQ